MSILKSKALWLNVIAIIIMVIQYLENWPKNPADWVIWEGLAVVVLNAIAGMVQSQTNATLKLENKTLKIQMEQALGHKSSD